MVAVGCSARIAASHCRIPSGDQPPAVTIHDDNYDTAVQPGQTHVVCDSSAYDFDVRQAARIALSATRQAEDYIQVELHAYDADGRELTLQDGTQVTWDTARTRSRLAHTATSSRSSIRASSSRSAPSTPAIIA
jgi:hypothetical protein